jgi:hypothetical protein
VNGHEAWHLYRLLNLLCGLGVLWLGWRVMRRCRLLLILAGVALWSLYGCGQQAPPPIAQITPVATPSPEPTMLATPTPKPTPDPYATYFEYGPEREVGCRLLRGLDIELPRGEQITDYWLSNTVQWSVVTVKSGEGGQVAHVIVAQMTPDAMVSELYVYTNGEPIYRFILKPNSRHPAKHIRFDG